MLTDKLFLICVAIFTLSLVIAVVGKVVASDSKLSDFYVSWIVVNASIVFICLMGWLIAFTDQNHNRNHAKWNEAKHEVRMTCYPYAYENRSKTKDGYQFSCANDKLLRKVNVK